MPLNKAIQENKISLSIQKLFELNLDIPDYQRPYKWKDKNINQLIDDIIFVAGNKKNYSIGSVVLFNANKKEKRSINDIFDVVDGQQRLTTLTILLHLCKGNINLPLLKSNYTSPISQANIINTKKIVNSRKSELTNEVIHYIIDKCYLNVFILSKETEAFQFFDSQNSRGLDLMPHDLLKAFHLREMQNNTEIEQINTVNQWEKYNKDRLDQFLRSHLFRVRRLSKQKSGLGFSKEKIETFKGVSLNSKIISNKLQKAKLLEMALHHYNSNYDRTFDNNYIEYPFEVNEIITNGKRFFEYVEYYKSSEFLFNISKYLVKDVENSFLIEKLKLNSDSLEMIGYVNSYNLNRKGDQALRNLFINLCFLYFDKFNTEKLDLAIQKIFVYVYTKRIVSMNIGWEDVDKYVLNNYSNSMFRIIEDSLTVKDFINIRLKSSDALDIIKKNNVLGKNQKKLLRNNLDELVRLYLKYT
ncbi:DUF262 domain-containing protein [Empedobacter brevis]|uniref:DUF262 domain-containing protein n=1 Tax=Empedobacter brevis TaxID=247 RepID=UPI003342B101